MLVDRLIAAIEREGPMPFDVFMESALYDAEQGYFASGALRSDRAGDFLTSAEVSPLFGETLAGFVDGERRRIGEPFLLAEVGGGSGSLMRPLLDALDGVPDVVAGERSEAARRAYSVTVPEARFADEVLVARGVVVANELLDNMPAALVVRHGESWVESAVGVHDGRLRFVEVEARPEVAGWADRYAGPVPDAGRVEVQLEVEKWVGETCARLEAGAVLLLDYGELAENLEHRRAEGTLRTYRGHHLGPDPLAQPGETDITMDVNFTAVIAAAEDAGADVEFLRQDEFLEALGLRERADEVRAAELEAARGGSAIDRLRLRSRLTEIETLLHPRGLGDFRVVIARK